MIKLKGAALAKKELIVLIPIVVVVSLFITVDLNVKAQYFPEYERYVHDYLNSGDLGNWTYVEKPVFPVFFNDSQIPIGQNWSVVCPLTANHSYHVYCYGAWVNAGSEPKTDYDIYVFNPLGEMEGYHTEAAGLPEHLGTTVDEAFFVPEYSGNYTFTIVNDARESNDSEQATFMIIENVECNKWCAHFVEGKDNFGLPVFNTSWAYEFVTESQRIEVWVKVPETLDMYEARLYLMSDAKAMNISGVPLPWEPGLYGNQSEMVGGYNMESEEYRGVAYASCEFYGQDMFLNFTSSALGKNLYHLVFLGEAGSGTIEFLVKTEFANACLKPLTVPSKAYPDNDTTVAYISNLTDLEKASLQYSADDWRSIEMVEMEITDGRTCSGVIPRQEAGSLVEYEVTANDALRNILTAEGNYTVKYLSTLNINATRETVRLGENITVQGLLNMQNASVPVTVYFTHTNETKKVECYTLENGTFTASFQPETVGIWVAHATFAGSDTFYESESAPLAIKVEEPSFFVKNSLYIGGGAIAIVAVSAVVYMKKFRR